jgi:hypothetical protein
MPQQINRALTDYRASISEAGGGRETGRSATRSRGQLAESFAIWTLRLAAGLLLVTGSAKLLSMAAGQKILLVDDPILGLPYRWTMLAGAILDLAAAGLLVSWMSHSRKLFILFLLGFAFSSYHAAVAILQPGSYCPCLGTLYGRLGLKASTANVIAQIMAGFFLLGPLVVWGTQWARRRSLTAKNAESAEVGGAARMEG